MKINKLVWIWVKVQKGGGGEINWLNVIGVVDGIILGWWYFYFV